MALARWSPISDISRLRDEMDRMFEQFFPSESREIPTISTTARMPSVDVYDREGNLVVEAELPGMKKDDVEVSIEDHTLTIRGETKREEEKKEEGFYRHERHYGRFVRSIPLPSAVRSDQAQAKFENGVLEIVLPKAEEEPKGRKIEVH